MQSTSDRGKGGFSPHFVLGDKAVAVARKSDLPAGVHKMIAEARCYAEGTAVRIEVHDAPDLALVKMLARIKNELYLCPGLQTKGPMTVESSAH